MPKREQEIVEKWQRSCVLVNNCRQCRDKVECLELGRDLELLRVVSLWRRKEG